MVLGADGGVTADVADDAAADLPRPRLGRRGHREEDGEGEAQLGKERPPAMGGRGHGWKDRVARWNRSVRLVCVVVEQSSYSGSAPLLPSKTPTLFGPNVITILSPYVKRGPNIPAHWPIQA